MNTKHLFFDLDNTLWDFRRNSEITLQKMFQQQNVLETHQVDFKTFHDEYYHVNENLWADFRDHKIDKNSLRERRFPDSFAKVGIQDVSLSDYFENNYLDEVIHYNHLVEGTEELIDYLLEKKYKLHILSNGFLEVTHKKVEGSLLKGKFHTITSAEEIDKRKPEPEVFLHAMEKANATPENSAMIGDDWIADMLGAENVGIHSLFFLNALQEDFSKEGITVIQKLAELREYL